MKIVHLSDIHFGAEIPELVGVVIDQVRSLAPHLVVISGDLTMAGRRREFRRAAEFIRSLQTPVVATPGNHDVPVYHLFDRFTRPFARYEHAIAPVADRSFLNDHAAVFSVNSARPWDISFNWSHGALSDVQIAQADAFFAACPQVPFRALVVHHPFYVPEDLPGFRVIANAEAMLRVLARHRVHAVLSGHLHRQSLVSRELPLETDVGSHAVLLMQVASATSTRRRQQPNAFNLLEVTDSGVLVTDFVEHDGSFLAGSRHEAISFHAAPRPLEVS